MGLWWAAEDTDPGPLADWTPIATAVSLLLALAGVLRWYGWYRGDWAGHPLVRVLTGYSETGLWRQTAADVNREFRR